MGLLDGIFGPSEPTPQERRKARADKRETRRIVGGNDTGEIADATASGAWSVSIEQEGGGRVTSKTFNRRGSKWPGQRISEQGRPQSGGLW
jgi:hypothetical protein